MRTLGKNNIEFPETKEEFDRWKPVIIRHALASRVLCVATTRVEGAWCAYCDAVPGFYHNIEQDDVLAYGDKLPENIAEVLFSTFKDIPYAL